VLQLVGVIHIPRPSYIYALLYSYNFVPKASYSGLLGSFHTLATEEHFYLLFAALFAVASLVGRVRAARILVLGFSALFLLAYLRPLFGDFEATHFVGRWTPIAMQPIVIGCFGGLLYNRALSTPESFAKIRLPEGFVYGSLLTVFLGLYAVQPYKHSSVSLSLAFLALTLALVLRPGAALSQALSNRALVYLGTISYGLYVWQSVFVGTGPSWRYITSPTTAVALVLVASVLSYELFEKKLLRLKDGFR
jgi:peptidoglycan/LPS O-acetylase OafA/YrhL